MLVDRPKLLGHPDALDSHLRELDQAHVAPLTKFVRKLRAGVGPKAAIPFFDPWDGGTSAQVLFLLEAPGPKAKGSGFISRNNPDETAKNFFELLKEAGIARKESAIWNVVPWYIGSETRIRPASSADISSGIESLGELLDLMPQLHGVVLVGGKARKASGHIRKLRPHIFIETCHHPSPMFVNRKPGNRQLLLDELRGVKARLQEAH